jgi:GNAT superfamily N-acetyltransferase
MSDNGTVVDELARALIELYGDLQRRLAADLARRLAAGMDRPSWAEDKLAAIATMRRWAETLLRQLSGPMADTVAQQIMLAYVRGGHQALDELARVQSTHRDWLRLARLTDPAGRLLDMIRRRRTGLAAELARVSHDLPGAAAINRLAFSLVSQLSGTHHQILRWQLDAYRDVIARAAAPQVLAGLATRRRAAQIAWEQLLSQGITGFTDRSGRRWDLASYVEMATRTTIAQAVVEGHLDRLTAAGLELVIVSDSPQECERCRPWEGKVLTIAGADGARERQMPSAVGRSTVTVHVAGSIAEAVAEGLMHPNCTHRYNAYLPGVTRLPTGTQNPQGYADRQKLRALERRVRKAKLAAAAVIDPAAQRSADAKIRDAQAAIRDHVAATGLIRQRAREQIGGGITPVPHAPSPPVPPAPAAAPPALPRRVRVTESSRVEDLPGLLEVDLGHQANRDMVRDVFADIIGGDYAGLTVEVKSVVDESNGPSRPGFSVRGQIYPADDLDADPIGVFDRSFYRDQDGDLVVVHALLALDRGYRGRGFASEFNSHLERWYRQQGISRIEVHANIDVGGYTWATQGFEFEDGESADDVLDRLRSMTSIFEERVGELREEAESATAQRSRELRAQARKLEAQVSEAGTILERADYSRFGDPDYPTSYEISQTGRSHDLGDQRQPWIGKAAMLGSDWHGVKWL